jgi:cell division protein FtsI (penicillin-binding protein 3)
MMVAMEDGYITNLNDTINTGNGEITFYKKTLKDSHTGGYGRISIQEVFEKSSNVGVSKLIWKYYKEQPTKFVNRIYKMRVNQKLGIEIKGEGIPKIKDPSDTTWSGITLPWMSIGYEVQLTPLQILTFYNAVANNGVMVKPQFVKEIRYHGELIKAFPTEILNPSICTKSTLEMAQKMLIGVVENGTAHNLKNPNYKIAGKTGTAQIALNNAGYSNSEGKKIYQASFVGYFPADKPKYSCIVVISSPSKSVYYGNLVAGPVFKEIADKVFATSLSIQPALAETQKLPVPSCKNGNLNDIRNICKEINLSFNNDDVNSDWVVVMPDTTTVRLKNRIIHTGQVPNVIGMGLKDAVYVLENSGLRVKVSGKGSVIKQSMEPGEKIMGNNLISIQLG